MNNIGKTHNNIVKCTFLLKKSNLTETNKKKQYDLKKIIMENTEKKIHK